MTGAQRVLVRQRWDGGETAEVAAEALWDLHVRNEPGGVCGPLPRGFLYGRVWCDKLAPGALGHVCRETSGPHELLVCILPNDNPAGVLQHLRASARS